MAVGTSLYHMNDLAKHLNPDGSVAAVIEMLAQKNGTIQDIPWMEGNLPTGHRYTVRTVLPTVGFRTLNGAVTPGRGAVSQADEGCGIMEAWLEVDELVAELGGNAAAFMTSEANAQIQAMNQLFETTLFYGNHGANPEQFQGLMRRYNSLSGTSAENIINGDNNGGTASGSDQTSIWLVVWGEGVHGIYPKGSMAGLSHKNWGKSIVENTAGIGGNRLAAYRHQFQWQCGLAVPDWQQVVRICNIDTSALTAQSSDVDLSQALLKAIQRPRDLQAGKPVLYMNRSVFQYLTVQRRNDVKGASIDFQSVDGELRYSYMGIPIRISDAITNTESVVA